MALRSIIPGLLTKTRPLLWLAILVLALAWRAQHLDAFSLSNDEGAHLMWARLAADGYPLYSETQAVQAPLFIEAVGLSFQLFGQSVETGRWLILFSFSLLATLLSWLAYRAGGWLAALVALVLLAVSPLCFTFSRLVMAEIPATALAVVSLALAFGFWDTGRRGWLVASGLALGLSFLTKALYPFLAVPVGLLLLWRCPWPGSWRCLGRDSLWWAAGVLFPLALTLLLYPPATLYDQLMRFRGDLRQAVPGSPAETWAQFELFLRSHWGFWLLAFSGIMAFIVSKADGHKAASERQPAGNLDFLSWTAWLAAGVVMLWWHTPLFPHHFVVLLPPLILLAAGFVARTVAWRAAWRLTPARGAALAVIVVASLNLPAMVTANRQTAAIVTGGREAEALKLLQAVSSPDDFLMGDSQLLIFMAGRRTPPPLGDVALVAIKAGRQTSARMIDLTRAYEAPAVVQWSLRLPWLPEYVAWVEDNYLARRVWDNDHIIYFGPRLSGEIPNERSVRLGDGVVLRGYELDPAGARAGCDFNLKVYWQATARLDRDYTIFTQLFDRTGSLVAGWDSQPLGGYLPTGRWPEGEIITDVVRLPLPADLPAGEYTLVTGMYLLETMERLPNLTETGDLIRLATVRID